MNKTVLTSILILAFMASSPLFADSWRFEPELKESEYNFSEIQIVKGMDSRENQRFPEFYIKIYKGNKQIAVFPGMSFEHIAASEDQTVFVAVSNSGLPKTALVLFDSSGSIRAFLNHGQGNLKYCLETVTLKRVWYDNEEPNVTFHYEDDRLSEITINSCNGDEIKISNLFKGTHSN